MPTNFYMFFVAAAIPLAIGAVYYHPMVVGNAWMKTNGFTAAQLQKGNMAVIFGLSYIFSVLTAVMLSAVVIHQGGVFGTIGTAALEAGSPEQADFAQMMAKYGNNFRTFGHGALHGFGVALLFALPIIGINALFERRGWKYILIHFGYWAITLTLMGGLLCQTLKYASPS